MNLETTGLSIRDLNEISTGDVEDWCPSFEIELHFGIDEAKKAEESVENTPCYISEKRHALLRIDSNILTFSSNSILLYEKTKS